MPGDIFPCSRWDHLSEPHSGKAGAEPLWLAWLKRVPWGCILDLCSSRSWLLEAVHVGLQQGGLFPLLYLAKTAVLWVAQY